MIQSRAEMCKLLRKTPKEIDEMDYKDFQDLNIVFKEMGDKNPLFLI
jgi:hypothetical protein